MLIQVQEWKWRIKRGRTFRHTITLKDENGDLVPLSAAQIDITPTGAAAFSLTQGNGKFTNVSPGVYLILIPASDTTGYTWSRGTYALNITETNGDVDPCLMESTITVEDC